MARLLMPVIAALICAASAHAGDASIPLTIEADRLHLEHGPRLAVFTGHVHLTRGDFELFCDRLTAHYGARSRISDALAEGSVRIRQGDVTGTAAKARYDAAADQVELVGEAVLIRPGGRVEGERIVHALSEKQTEVAPADGGRARMVIDEENAP